MEFCNTNNICRLCLKSCDDARVLDETIISDLHSILLYLDFAITEEPTVCQQCLENIKNCINFKAKCVLNENVTIPLVSNGNDSKIKLEYDSSNCNSCRFCLEEVTSGSSVSLENDEVEMLRKYFLDYYDTCQLVTCMSCIKYMRCHFDFIANCLQIEENISDYCDIEGTNNKGQVDLNNIINFISRNKDELRNSPYTIKVEEIDIVDVDLDIKCEVKAEDDDTKQEEDSNIENVIESKIDSSESVSSQNMVYLSHGLKKCGLCSYTNKRSRYVRRHMLCHKSLSEVTAYSCDQCAFKTKYKNCLREHMIVHKSVDEVVMHKCELCVYQSKRHSGLKSHMKSHMKTHCSEVKTYKCSECVFETKNKRFLETHVANHESSAGNGPFDTGSKMAIQKCPECGFLTKHSSSLWRHMQLHKPAMCRCPECGYEANHRYNLQRHMRRHKRVTDPPKYVCDICAFETKHKYNLVRHMPKHRRDGATRDKA